MTDRQREKLSRSDRRQRAQIEKNRRAVHRAYRRFLRQGLYVTAGAFRKAFAEDLTGR